MCNLRLCQDYRTISLISHSSKVMLKVILNTLRPQAEEIIAEEQAWFRAGRSTTEQILSLRILCEKYLQHQQNLYRVFMDFKKAFDRVWQSALWARMRKYNISANLVHTTEQLYDKSTSAVQMNGEDVFCHPPSSTFFSNGSCLMPWKNMTGRLA